MPTKIQYNNTYNTYNNTRNTKYNTYNTQTFKGFKSTASALDDGVDATAREEESKEVKTRAALTFKAPAVVSIPPILNLYLTIDSGTS